MQFMAWFDYENKISAILSNVSPNLEIQLLPWGLEIAAPYVWVKEECEKISVVISNADSVLFNDTVERISKMFELHEYPLTNSRKLSEGFLDNKIELLFVNYFKEVCNEKQKAIREELISIAAKHNLKFHAYLNMRDWHGWINFSQIEANDYKIQISTLGDFQEYDKLRSEISNIFIIRNAVLASENDYGKGAIGYQKELIFLDKKKYEAKKNEAERMKGETVTTMIQTLINGDVNTSGGNLNAGNADIIDNGTNIAPPDAKWFQKEVVKMLFSFIAGIGATLISQWMMRLLGWIK